MSAIHTHTQLLWMVGSIKEPGKFALPKSGGITLGTAQEVYDSGTYWDSKADVERWFLYQDGEARTLFVATQVSVTLTLIDTAAMDPDEEESGE